MEQYASPPGLIGYNFTPSRAFKARDESKLLSIRVETSLMCNLRCRYCNGISGKAPPGEISYEDIIDVILQAKALGVESVVVIGGGEPTVYPKFRDLIDFIHGHSLVPVVWTNTTNMTRNLASFLFERNTSVMIKLDSLDPQQQDYLAGKKGAFNAIMRGLDHLLSVGFADGDTVNLRLGASFVTTSLTIGETSDIWRFCRQRNIYPNQELLVPRGRALDGLEDLSATVGEIMEIKQTLLRIDQEEFGYTWFQHAPLTGHGCFQNLYSIYLDSFGYLRTCADVDIKEFNIRDITLKDALNSTFFQTSRNIQRHLTGKCADCGSHDVCIGCRGIAFSTGIGEGLSPLEALCREDPLCGLHLQCVDDKQSDFKSETFSDVLE